MNRPYIARVPLVFSALTLLFCIAPGAVLAQSVAIGADVASRYVWRGYDFGESFSVQPTLEYTQGPVSVGSWASYSISADGSGANEHDLYLSVVAGPVSLGVTDYYFPTPPDLLGEDATTAEFFNFDGGGNGAHYVEPFVSYQGPGSFPIALYAAAFVYNDPDHSVYLEASYPFVIDGVDLGVTLGAVPLESSFYGTDGFSIVNIGLSASKAVSITESFALPLSVSYILNPDMERTYLVFGISF